MSEKKPFGIEIVSESGKNGLYTIFVQNDIQKEQSYNLIELEQTLKEPVIDHTKKRNSGRGSK